MSTTKLQLKLMLTHAGLTAFLPSYINDGLTDEEACQKLSKEEASSLAAQLNHAHQNNNKIKLCIGEGGAEFIGPQHAYPNTHKMLERLGVPLKAYDMSSHIHEKGKPENGIVFPPYHKPVNITSVVKTGFFSSCSNDDSLMINVPKIAKRIAKNGDNYLLTLWAIERAKETAAENNPQMLETFVEKWKKIGSDWGIADKIDEYANTIMYPLVAGSWGVPISTAKTYLAHYAINYLTLGDKWFDASTGLSSYMEKLEMQCENQASIHKNKPAKKLIAVEGHGAIKYKVLLQDNSELKDENGKIKLFDEIILATPATQTAEILPDTFSTVNKNPELERKLQETKQKLQSVPTFKTHLAFHLDHNPMYETQKETVVHIRVENDDALNNAQKDFKGPLQKAWAPEHKPKPSSIITERHWVHPHMTIEYFAAQQDIRSKQKLFPGMQFATYAGLGDSHEDRLTVALQIAQQLHIKYQLDPKSNERLATFLDESGKILEYNSQLSTAKAGIESEEKTFCTSFACC